MTRNRTCHFGEASIDCIGSPSQSQDCNTQPCGKFLLNNVISTAVKNTLARKILEDEKERKKWEERSEERKRWGMIQKDKN